MSRVGSGRSFGGEESNQFATSVGWSGGLMSRNSSPLGGPNAPLLESHAGGRQKGVGMARRKNPESEVSASK